MSRQDLVKGNGVQLTKDFLHRLVNHEPYYCNLLANNAIKFH
jgi:hypothetical protein